MTHQFFNLPYEEKLKIKMTPAGGYRLYTLFGIYDNSFGPNSLAANKTCYINYMWKLTLLIAVLNLTIWMQGIRKA